MSWRLLMLAATMWITVAPAATVTVNVDTSQDRRAIDPRIYGVNFATAAMLANPGYPLNRWGGNATTRYNWQVDVSNRGSDYVYLNVSEGNGQNLPNDSGANRFLAETLAAGADPILTVGTIGWTPINLRQKRYGFSIIKYGPQLQNQCPFDCDGGNGQCDAAVNTTQYCVAHAQGPDLIVGNDETDTSQVAGPQWNRDWIAHLKTRHGTAAAGGVRLYALDNEVMLWNSTHRDVHPAPTTYDEIWAKTLAHGAAIKAEDAGAQVLGPVTWGYCDLFGSAADNCHVGSDRAAHGNLPFVQWYLRQVCANPIAPGVRAVDILDLHYYPQGSGLIDFNSDNLGVSENAANSAKRLRSLKELYDPNWVSESWIADLGAFDQWTYSRPHLIRRAKAWIDAECPGMGLAITEYNWGPDEGLSSALAQVEILGIFGREGVDLATRWVAPEVGTVVERAFRVFLNYDGNGSRVEGDSVRATSSNVDLLGSYAVELEDERLMLVLVNKDTTTTTAQMSFAQSLTGAWTVYRFGASTDVAPVANGAIAGTTLSLSLPARSASLLVLPASGPDPDAVFDDGFESP